MCNTFFEWKNRINTYYIQHPTNNMWPLHRYWESKLPSFITWSPDPSPPIPDIAGLIRHKLLTPARGRQINRIHNTVYVCWCNNNLIHVMYISQYQHISAETCAHGEAMHISNIHNHIYINYFIALIYIQWCWQHSMSRLIKIISSADV